MEGELWVLPIWMWGSMGGVGRGGGEGLYQSRHGVDAGPELGEAHGPFVLRLISRTAAALPCFLTHNFHGV